MNKVLITGITGQIASYMAEYYLERGYVVHGLDRRKAVPNYRNIEKIRDQIQIIEGDITDAHCMSHVIQAGQYDEIVNTAAQSHVGTSFKEPAITFDIDTVGVVNLLEAIRRYSKHSRFYTCSTSELFGKSLPPQNEKTPLMPQSPYGCAKLAAHHMVRIYSQAYGLKAVAGIMFNTESPRRGDNFVTKKIINWAKEWSNMLLSPNGWKVQPLLLGNLYTKRDWSHATDAVDAIYRILHQDSHNKNWSGEWKSYVFGSGVAASVKDFLQLVLDKLVDENPHVSYEFSGSGLDEQVTLTLSDETSSFSAPVVKISQEFYRPAEVDFLLCDPTLIKAELGWQPKHDLKSLVNDMFNN